MILLSLLRVGGVDAVLDELIVGLVCTLFSWARNRETCVVNFVLTAAIDKICNTMHGSRWKGLSILVRAALRSNRRPAMSDLYVVKSNHESAARRDVDAKTCSCAPSHSFEARLILSRIYSHYSKLKFSRNSDWQTFSNRGLCREDSYTIDLPSESGTSLDREIARNLIAIMYNTSNSMREIDLIFMSANLPVITILESVLMSHKIHDCNKDNDHRNCKTRRSYAMMAPRKAGAQWKAGETSRNPTACDSEVGTAFLFVLVAAFPISQRYACRKLALDLAAAIIADDGIGILDLCICLIDAVRDFLLPISHIPDQARLDAASVITLHDGLFTTIFRQYLEKKGEMPLLEGIQGLLSSLSIFRDQVDSTSCFPFAAASLVSTICIAAHYTLASIDVNATMYLDYLLTVCLQCVTQHGNLP